MQLPFQMVGWGARDVGVFLKLFGFVPIAILVFVRCEPEKYAHMLIYPNASLGSKKAR